MSFNKNNAQHSNPLEKKAMTATSTIQAYKDDTKREKRSLGLRSLLCPSLSVKIHKLLIICFSYKPALQAWSSCMSLSACTALQLQDVLKRLLFRAGPSLDRVKDLRSRLQFLYLVPQSMKGCTVVWLRHEKRGNKEKVAYPPDVHPEKKEVIISRVKLKQAKLSLITRNFGGKDCKYQELCEVGVDFH